MKKRSSHAAKAYRIVSCIALAAALFVVVWQSLGNGTGHTSVSEDFPHEVELRWYMASSAGQRTEKVLLGESPTITSLSVFPQSECHLKLINLGGDGHLSKRYTRAGYAYYDITSAGGSGNWVATLRVPEKVDPQNPIGTWRVLFRSNDTGQVHSQWLTLNHDGTGIFGDGAVDVLSDGVEKEEIEKRQVACMWHMVRTQGGALVVLEYENGQLVIVVHE